MEFKTIGRAKLQTGLSYLGKCGSSSKIIKSSKILNIDTYILYLAPNDLSGYNVCPLATKECIAGCLNTSGRAGMELRSKNENRIFNSRIKKTKLFYENREFFMNWLISEIKAERKISEKKGNQFAVRLNGTSDLNWVAYKINNKNIFEIFPDVQFYDYTKVPKKFDNIPNNYHLTFSYTGYNWNNAKKILNSGNNVAVVFNIQKFYNQINIKPLPTLFKGYEVINGDITDYRPNDKKGVIVGLHWKSIANKNVENFVRSSPFVVNPYDIDCYYDNQKAA